MQLLESVARRPCSERVSGRDVHRHYDGSIVGVVGGRQCIRHHYLTRLRVDLENARFVGAGGFVVVIRVYDRFASLMLLTST